MSEKKCPICKQKMPEPPKKILTKEILNEALKFLTPRDYAVLYMRCILEGNLQKVGYEFSVTSERIRCIEEKAFKKLKNWYKFNFLYHIQVCEIVELLKENRFYWPLLPKNFTTKSGFFVQKETLIIDDKLAEIEEGNIDIALEYLGLSLRSHNCLKNAGIITIKDLVNMPVDEIHKIKNLGRKCWREIDDALKQLSIQKEQIGLYYEEDNE